MVKLVLRRIPSRVAIRFLLPKHYAGRTPVVSYAFGWYRGEMLEAVCTFGKPASPQLCYGICGRPFAGRVYELNRVCRINELTEPLSQFVSGCLRQLKPANLIIVSYSDTAMHHHGYLYQACNFLYTGATKARTDLYNTGANHARHSDRNFQDYTRTLFDDTPDTKLRPRKRRSSKHRYVFFAMQDRQLKRKATSALNYPVQPYPKGDNQTYQLGDYLAPDIITPSI